MLVDEAQWQQQVAALEAMDAAERIAWAVKRFGPGTVATSSFGADSVVLLHLIACTAPELPVYFLDTGFLFAETLRFKARLEAALGLAVREWRPPLAAAAFVARHGELYRSDPDRCCALNKVAVLERALQGATCWISGIRRDQAPTRTGTPVLERRADGLHKLNPLFDWDAARVRRYVTQHRLPVHPLAEAGYTSIGCWPCTAPPRPGENARSGRWQGREKTECGIHHLFGERD